MNNSVIIAVAYHRKSHIVSNDCLVPIQVGAANHELDLGIQRDDQGDNISHLNPFLSEMTAMYYLWKNCKGRHYYGLCHYRRFFTYQPIPLLNVIFDFMCFYLTKVVHCFNSHLRYTRIPYVLSSESNLEEKQNIFLNRLLNEVAVSKFDFYCTKKVSLSTRTVYEHFSFICGYQRIDELKGIIENHYTDYLPYLVKSLKSSSYYSANLAIFSADLFDRYNSFVFNVLRFHFGLNMGDWETVKAFPSQRLYLRQPGYLAELLTDVFIRKLISEGKKHKEVNILYVLPDNEIIPKNKFTKFLLRMGIFNVNFLKK